MGKWGPQAEEGRKKLSESVRKWWGVPENRAKIVGRKRPFRPRKKGWHHSLKTREKMSRDRLGKPKSPAHIAKLTGSGNGNWRKGLHGKRNPRFGKAWSSEVKEKISLTLSGRALSANHREKLSAVNSGAGNGNYKHGGRISSRNQRLWANLRKSTLERDKGCVLCGSTQDLTAHHKDGNPEKHLLDNLVTLCRSCHAIVHGIARKWKTSQAVKKAVLLADSIGAHVEQT